MSNPQHVDRPSDDDPQIQWAGWWVGLVCACALGPTGWKLFIEILLENGKLNEAAVQAMFQVFILTGPLVLSIALTAVILIRMWIDPQTPAVVFVPALILIGSLFLSNVAGVGIGPVKPEELLPYSGGLSTAFAFIVNILFGYAKVYGYGLFIASIVLGLFLGYVTAEKMPPFVVHIEQQLKNS